MPTYNRDFQLTIGDVDMIEEALRARRRELCRTHRALGEQHPADLQSMQVIDADLKAGEELLGRLHNQKIFYRPQNAVYVGG
jgi:ABC-type phosphonate transport system ATPase subunit